MHKIDLKEIKAGQTGSGLLIENDGYISLIDNNNKQLYESLKMNEETGTFNIPNPFVVSAVFQKYGIENANKRIYPEDILKREVDKFQVKIREHRAYGECYTPDTLILTKSGWKALAEVKKDEEVLTLNTETNEIEIQPISKKIEYEYDGDMIRIKGRNINDFVTPNHGFPIYNKDGIFEGFFTAEEIMNKKVNDQNHSFIPKIDKKTANIDDFSILDGKKFPIKGIYLDEKMLNVTKEHYKGTVMCVEVPNHTWYCKCNNKSHWTKNCNHPSDSTIDLGRLAMNIIELHWEGNTLIGKIEIPVSQGFRKLGIISCLADMVAHWILSKLKIGVSSRGLGSVEQRYGKLVVGDDFELICWDIVSEPSTPGAWISENPEELSTYIESAKKDNSKLMEEDKFEKFNNWLGII